MLIERLVTAGKRLALAAGALYLLIVGLGGIAHLAVHAGIRVPGYAANAAQNVAAGPTLAPVSLATDLAMATIFAVVGVTVYLLPKVVTAALARADGVETFVGRTAARSCLLTPAKARLPAPRGLPGSGRVRT